MPPNPARVGESRAHFGPISGPTDSTRFGFSDARTSQMSHYFENMTDLTSTVVKRQTESVLAALQMLLSELAFFAVFETWPALAQTSSALVIEFEEAADGFGSIRYVKPSVDVANMRLDRFG